MMTLWKNSRAMVLILCDFRLRRYIRRFDVLIDKGGAILEASPEVTQEAIREVNQEAVQVLIIVHSKWIEEANCCN